jgi:uncharacterized membrane protein YbjE (DUF340 family)
MLIALSSILPVLAALVLGAGFPRFGWSFVMQRVNGLTNICLYVLLVMMGVSVGQVKGIDQKLAEVGFTALFVALSASLGVAAMLTPMLLSASRRVGAEDKHGKGAGVRFVDYIKDPAQLLGLVAVGFVLAYAGIVPSLNYDGVVSVLLYLLIFLIGIKLSQGNFSLMQVLFNRRALLIACLTFAGTYLGLLLFAWFSGRPVGSVLVLGSGFGWYTLSGIMLTQFGDPLLGSTAFFADVFREMIALVLIPTLARSGAAPVAIGVCGATCMDVTLPVIERHCAVDDVKAAFASGAIITLLVPFLIPATYYFVR